MIPLASLSDLAVATGRETTDPELVLALDRASARFRLEVEHDVTLVEDEEIWLDGDGGRTLLLPAVPITDIAVTVGLTSLVEGTDYTVSRGRGILTRSRGLHWPYGGGTVRVIYSHGYTVIPQGIADAVLEHATTLAESFAHVSQESATSASVTYGAQATVGVTQKWATAVRKYKLAGRA